MFGLSRVVRTFGTEEREVSRYKRWLQALRDINIRQAFAYLMYLVAASSLFNLTKVHPQTFDCIPPPLPKFTDTQLQILAYINKLDGKWRRGGGVN